jgi:two-component system, cell cycle sensor histidine kinase and response regulator CckA
MRTTSTGVQSRETRSNEAIGRLAGGVAHDVNNLLMVILCYADLVLDHLPQESPVRRDALEIKGAAESAARVTSELVALSQQQELLPRPLDISAIVSELGSTLRRAVGDEVELIFDLAEELPPVEADRGQIERIVMNLVVNARDVLEPGGRVTVTTRADQETRRVRLSIADTGPGIPKELLARIFEPFFTTKACGKGTGLGLAIVQVLVAQTGATIDVHTRAGQGTTFVLTWTGRADG